MASPSPPTILPSPISKRLIGDVPSQRAKEASFLDHRMEEAQVEAQAYSSCHERQTQPVSSLKKRRWKRDKGEMEKANIVFRYWDIFNMIPSKYGKLICPKYPNTYWYIL